MDNASYHSRCEDSPHQGVEEGPTEAVDSGPQRSPAHEANAHEGCYEHGEH
jgi:hypothetical protein